MPDQGNGKRVLMSHKVAERWLKSIMCPEYRIKVLYGAQDIRNMVGMMSSFRDGRFAMRGVPRVADLGIRDSFDGLELWSKNREGLLAVQQWFEKRGFETTGIW